MNHYIRLGIYAVVGAVSFVLLFLGYITPDHVDQAYVLIGQFLGMGGSVLALANLNPKPERHVTEQPKTLHFESYELPTAIQQAKNKAPWLEQTQ